MTTDEMIAEIHAVVVKKKSPSDAVTLAAAKVCNVWHRNAGWEEVNEAIGEMIGVLYPCGSYETL